MINHRHLASALKKKLAMFFETHGYKPDIEIVYLDGTDGPRGSMMKVNFQSEVGFQWHDIMCYRSVRDSNSEWRVMASFKFGLTTYELLVTKKPYYVPVRRIHWHEVQNMKEHPHHYMFTTN